MFKLLLVCVLVAAAAAQTHHTKHPHNTHNPHTQNVHHTHPPHTTNVHEAFHFFLDRVDGKMLIRTSAECFVFTLNAKQLASVDTPTGVRDLEIRLVGMIGTGTQSPMKQDDITKIISHHCGKNPVITVAH